MTHIGTKTGTGELLVEDNEYPNIKYRINVWQKMPGGLKEATGSLSGDVGALHAAFDKGGAKLVLEDGGSVDILVARIQIPSGGCDIRISGPVPGM